MIEKNCNVIEEFFRKDRLYVRLSEPVIGTQHAGNKHQTCHNGIL